MNEQEHLNEIRQDNKKALPKFLLIMAASLVLGGVLGFFGGRLGDLGMKETLASAADRFSRYAAPWLLYACTLASVLGFFAQTHLTRKSLAQWDGEDETMLNAVDGKLTVFLWLQSMELLLGYALFPMAVMGSLHQDNPAAALISAAALLILMGFCTVSQQKTVDATRQLYPEKQGSVYSTGFQKTWLNSCDEAEKRIIGQCCYRVYQAVTRTCLVLWVLFALGILLLEMSVVPMLTVCLIWGVSQCVYYRNAIKLSRPGTLVS